MKTRTQSAFRAQRYNAPESEKAAALCRISADDIAPPQPKPKFFSRENSGRLLRSVLMLISGTVFAVCACMLGFTLYDHARAQEMYEDLDNFMFERGDEYSGLRSQALAADSPLPDFDSMRSFHGSQFVSTESSQYIALMRAKISSLKASNDDVVGYITVPNTKISYPIMHSGDNEYYLNHDYLGNYRLSGAIFLDYRNFTDIPINENSCIYGHNLTNGNMMNNITLFLDKEFFDANQYIEIITEKGLYTYQIFAVYKTDMYSDYITTYFATPEEVIEFAELQQSRSVHQREGVTFETGTKLLTLSTCTNVIQEERYTLQAKLVGFSE